MRWINHYQLFLFDLDGLLVNTEHLHYLAYKKMCKDRGFDLPWDFPTYFSIAQQDADAPRKFIYREFPELYEQEPRWDILYAEKKRAYLELLHTEEVPLLAGAEKLLRTLEKANANRCVVTHSGKTLVDALKEKNPVLNSVPHWLTREDYDKPKPAPDGYLKAIKLLAKPEDRIVGFEDSDRGLRALMATRAYPILVNSIDQETREKYQKQGIRTFKTLDDVCAVDTDSL